MQSFHNAQLGPQQKILQSKNCQVTTQRSIQQNAVNKYGPVLFHRRKVVQYIQMAGLCGVFGLPQLPEAAHSAQNTDLLVSQICERLDDVYSLYVPDVDQTPALRAGVIDPSTRYKMIVPSSWRVGKLPNAATGNYCMPKCGEPWTEINMYSADEGKVTLRVFDAKLMGDDPKNMKVQDLGPPEQVVQQIGSLVTGTLLDNEDVSKSSQTTVDGLTYYYYESYAPYGTEPPYSLFRFTIKNGLGYLLTAQASEKQWAKSAEKLRAVEASFRA